MKKCVKGKSCSSTCISNSYACRVSLEDAAKRVLRELRQEAKAERRDKITTRVALTMPRLEETSLANLESDYDWIRKEWSKEKDQEFSDVLLPRLIALRQTIRQRKQEQEEISTDPDEMVRQSPKYSETPRADVMKAKDLKGEWRDLEEQIDTWKKQAIAEGMYREKDFNRWAENYRDRLRMTEEAKSALPAAEAKVAAMRAKHQKLMDEGKGDTPESFGLMMDIVSEVGKVEKIQRQASTPPAPPLSTIYRRQGFDAKPELVRGVKDLENHPNLLKGSDGENIVAFRGVSNEAYADQFRAGADHYSGTGIHGNGSYSAYSLEYSKKSYENSRQGKHYDALREASAYSNIEQKRSVVAFGLRSDARLYRLDGSYENRKKLVEEAQAKSGYRVSDPGEAAAILGYDALNVDAGIHTNYFVVLNRGAVVAATDAP